MPWLATAQLTCSVHVGAHLDVRIGCDLVSPCRWQPAKTCVVFVFSSVRSGGRCDPVCDPSMVGGDEDVVPGVKIEGPG